MSTKTRAKVITIHPEDHSCDVRLLRDGSLLAGLQVLSSSASTNTGLNDLPTPSTPPAGQWIQRTDRDIIAIVDWCDGVPYVEGFLFPQICQMTFKEANRKVDRHASDFYHTVDAAGNAEWYHPSGTYLRMGESPAHEDLTGKDVDKKWAITKNTTRAPHVQLVVASAGAAALTINIDPGGNLTVTSAAGAATLVFPGGTTIDTPLTTMTGDLKVDGNIKADGEITDHTRSMQGDRDIYNIHTHPANATQAPNQQM
jgi:hypothetical protein